MLLVGKGDPDFLSEEEEEAEILAEINKIDQGDAETDQLRTSDEEPPFHLRCIDSIRKCCGMPSLIDNDSKNPRVLTYKDNIKLRKRLAKVHFLT